METSQGHDEEKAIEDAEKAVANEKNRLEEVESGNVLDKLYYSEDRAAVNRAADETAFFYGGGMGCVVGAAVAASISGASPATVVWCLAIGAVAGVVVGYLVKQRATK